MPDYKSMYFRLFNEITNVVDILQNAQSEGESSFIESDDAPIEIAKLKADEKKPPDSD